jgi:hypothetical protein
LRTNCSAGASSSSCTSTRHLPRLPSRPPAAHVRSVERLWAGVAMGREIVAP